MERRTYQPRLDQLEDREVPATFGIPWADPLHLTLSFTPDGTAIAGQTHSQLFQALNAQRSASVWQRDVLRAIQTWAAVANVNVGVVPDSGAPFGTPAAPGLAPFGDLRVGAQPMAATALAVGVPPDPFFSGTWAGDVFLNSATSLYTANTDLFSIALHEVGHALGLPNSTDPTSVMYGQAIRARTGPACRTPTRAPRPTTPSRRPPASSSPASAAKMTSALPTTARRRWSATATLPRPGTWTSSGCGAWRAIPAR
jgi:hypothetical protein